MEKKQNFNGGRFFLGFILLLLGLVMILYRAGVLDWELYDFLLSWKMLMVVIGAFIFFNGSKSAGIIVMGLGTFLMLPDIFEDYYKIKRYFWPVVVLLVGVSLMFAPKPKRIKKHSRYKHNPPDDDGGSNKQTFYSDSKTSADNSGNTEYRAEDNMHYDFKSKNVYDASSDYFDEFVIFGSREINMSTLNLLGGRSTAVFGGSDIDLRQCQISPEGCTIDVTTLFGGHVLKVPNNWTVLNKVTTIFGGYSDLRIKDPHYAPDPSKTVVITGVCIFGGTEVRNIKIH